MKLWTLFVSTLAIVILCSVSTARAGGETQPNKQKEQKPKAAAKPALIKKEVAKKADGKSKKVAANKKDIGAPGKKDNGYKALAEQLEALVRAGKISKEKAIAKLAAAKRAPQKKKADGYTALAERLEALVQAGKISKEKAIAKLAAAKKVSAKKAPAKKAPAKKAPAKKEPAKKEPAKKAPAKKEPAKKEPAKKAPAKKAPAKKKAVDKSNKGNDAKAAKKASPKSDGKGKDSAKRDK